MKNIEKQTKTNKEFRNLQTKAGAGAEEAADHHHRLFLKDRLTFTTKTKKHFLFCLPLDGGGGPCQKSYPKQRKEKIRKKETSQ